MNGLHIRYTRPATLTAYPNNARTHSPRQIAQIAASIQRFGFLNPVLIDRDGVVIAGHGRVAAATMLELEQIPTVCIDQLSPAEVRAYRLADNKLAELAGWDSELLALEFQGLSDLELDFDLTLTGFEAPVIDGFLQSASADPEPEDEPLPAGPAVTQLGDRWDIGQHRLVCGDARDPATYAALLGTDTAQLVFTDPPYNVPIDGHVSGLGDVKHREFSMAAGEMSPAEFTAFLQATFAQLAAVSQAGAIHYVCMDWRHLSEVLAAGNAVYTELKNLCVWAKTNGGMGSLYRSQHELICVFKVGTAAHINNVELGRHGRYRTNLWSYPGMNAFGAERDAELALHPTVKPVALVADAILDCSERGGWVLDAFAGSGTTLLAAERTGRRGAGIELDPLYCDVIVRRMMALGLEATHASGSTFDQLAAERAQREVADEIA
ncbi:MAG: DNA methyltransferase [Gammaproteobacteria bacterium]|jgi:DNA modification methylase|nr:DNA methyltransferase [Gammaproteobacteria bacterium]